MLLKLFYYENLRSGGRVVISSVVVCMVVVSETVVSSISVVGISVGCVVGTNK